jgi:hypothetical protein
MSMAKGLVSVHFASMTNGYYVDNPTPIVQQVDHTVIAKANAPEILSTFEFPVPDRSRLRSQQLNLRKEPFDQLGR